VTLTLALAGLMLVYARGWVRLRSSRTGATSVRRLAAFVGGVSALWLAVGSPLGALDHRLLTFHMVQHLVIMLVAAPLVLLGAPVPTLLAALPERHAVAARAGSFAVAPVRALGRLFAHPVVCWLAGTGVVIGWHVPAILALTLHARAWHGVQQASFLAAGLLFWWPVILPWPAVPRWPLASLPLYLFLATLPCDALSAFLAFSGRVLYTHYLGAGSPAGFSPLADQELAGALMWFSVTVAYLLPAMVLTVRMLSPAQARRTLYSPKLASARSSGSGRS
jgi:putative membrane protein